MTSTDHSYEPHLELCELSLAPGSEWMPRPSGWSLCQVDSGAGYWLHPDANQELLPGTLILRNGPSPGKIRASQLGSLSLRFFHVEPSRLTGLLSLGEQEFLETASTGEKVHILPSSDPIAIRMTGLGAAHNQSGCFVRLLLLQLFLEIFHPELKQQISRQQTAASAKDRLRELMNVTPATDFLHMNFSELSAKMGCTPRHLTRTFRDVIGITFREKQVQLRLVRARELLVTTDSKIVDVALESGFQSLSIFNMMFRRRFGVSPGKWREIRRPKKRAAIWSMPKTRRFASPLPEQVRVMRTGSDPLFTRPRSVVQSQ